MDNALISYTSVLILFLPNTLSLGLAKDYCRPETHIKRQAAQYDFLPRLLGDGDT
jgi:hypothetical protein